jgi:prophage maintenance system killer protein
VAIVFQHPEIAAEYQRWKGLVGPEDPYASRETVGLHDILIAHFLIADFFVDIGLGLGGIGPKSVELLHSACFRQFTSFGGIPKWTDPLKLCSSLLYGLVMNHPFHDANKRTAFLVTLWQLDRIGRTPRHDVKQLEDFLVEIASNQLSKHAAYKALLKGSGDPEVEFIAETLRKGTRHVDLRTYTVTYHELNQILHSYGFGLVNPYRNHIDVVRVENRRRILGVLGPMERHNVFLGQIGFPGWKREVGQEAIRTVRKVTGLTAEQGFDSQVFFYGKAPVSVLVDIYAEPLKRLAHR